MKKLLFLIVAALAVGSALSDVVRVQAPTYNQVAGISNQVLAVDSRLYQVAADASALKNLVLGSEASSPFLGGIRVTFNTGATAYVPQGEEYYKAINGAYLTVQLPNEVYTFPVGDIRAGAIQQVYVPCDDFVDAQIRLTTGPAKHLYSSGSQLVHVHRGQLTDVVIDTLPPLVPPPGQEEALRMFGRAQYYDPENTYGKRAAGDSFPIQRVWDASANAWVTQFGYYSNSVWVVKCDVYNEIPQLDSTGGYTNIEELDSPDGRLAHAYESRAFPWKDCQRVAAVLDPAMLNANGQDTPATNVYFFSRIPIYAFKESIETLTITNFSAAGAVSSVAEYPMQIRWIADPAITNGYDSAFYIPSWEKVYARDYDDVEGTWTTREIGVKEANYYATYKSAPTSAKNNNWRMVGNNNYTLQSYPWPHRDGSNYGVSGLTRATMNNYAHKLNPFDLSMWLVKGTTLVRELAFYAAPTNTDMENRRWAGNTWHDYQAFRELAYIQFGANVQSTANEVAGGLARCIGIVGNQTTSVLEARQDDLEFYFGEQTNLVTFTIAPRASNGYSFAWLGILNFWGSEGDQMADVTVVNETDSDSTKSIWYLANLDRSRFIPDSSGTATSYATFTDTHGYERLSYYAAYTGLSGTYYRGKDSKANYAAFNLMRTTPESATDLFAVNLSSSAYDAMWVGSYPAVPASGSNYSYFMCSLSDYRGGAIGPWSVRAYYAPSGASAHYWGARASINLLPTEREARSGQ